MALLGTLMLVFIVIHMKQFWYEMHWGPLGMDADGNKDLYTLVAASFTQLVVRRRLRDQHGGAGLPPVARFLQRIPILGPRTTRATLR